MISVQLTRSTNWNCFLLDRLDERKTLYTINFTKICQKSFLYSKWSTIISETSTKMAISKSNGSIYSFYPDLPKISFIQKMRKSKIYTGNEHLLSTQNGNLQV